MRSAERSPSDVRPGSEPDERLARLKSDERVADKRTKSSKRFRIMPTIASIVLGLVLGGTATVPAPVSSAASHVTLGRFSVRVETSSGWTGVRFTPGQIVAHRITAATAGTDVRPFSQGWMIVPPAGRTAVVNITAVFEEPQRQPSIAAVVTKGARGRTVLDVVNRSGKPFTVAHVVNDRRRSGEVRATRTRSQFLGLVSPPMQKADGQRLVLAFYHPWFGGYGQPTLADRPVERLRTNRPDEVLAMTRQAHEHGIDGFIVSWAGERNGDAFDYVVRAGEQTGHKATVAVETNVANAGLDANQPPDPAVVRQWLRQALGRASSPAFLRSGGVPVVFVWQMKRLRPPVWAQILGELAAEGLRVRLVGDAPLAAYGSVSWGYYRYDPNPTPIGDLPAWNRRAALDGRLLAAENHAFVASVSPGLDAHNLPGDTRAVVPRGPNGERYASSWNAALTADPDWIAVTSWNEWFEGTQVQPGVSSGDLSLRQTDEFSARFES